MKYLLLSTPLKESLVQVYGFVERSGGAINVSPKLNKGTKVIICFTRKHQENTKKKENNHTAIQLQGSESIYIVVDENLLRKLYSSHVLLETVRKRLDAD